MLLRKSPPPPSLPPPPPTRAVGHGASPAFVGGDWPASPEDGAGRGGHSSNHRNHSTTCRLSVVDRNHLRAHALIGSVPHCLMVERALLRAPAWCPWRAGTRPRALCRGPRGPAHTLGGMPHVCNTSFATPERRLRMPVVCGSNRPACQPRFPVRPCTPHRPNTGEVSNPVARAAKWSTRPANQLMRAANPSLSWPSRVAQLPTPSRPRGQPWYYTRPK